MPPSLPGYSAVAGSLGNDGVQCHRTQYSLAGRPVIHQVDPGEDVALSSLTHNDDYMQNWSGGLEHFVKNSTCSNGENGRVPCAE